MMEPDIMETVNSESVSDIMRKIIRINATSFADKQELFSKLEMDRALYYLFKTQQNTVFVKGKNGRVHMKQIDQNKNIQAITLIQEIINKNKVTDIFSSSSKGLPNKNYES
mmetsp:Transcript_39118/g.59676  ORF Transcript_39118/g.59676 Transcript_39118/m.59676 type:complete len:111 (+) Transcript_39118:3319-3651(+)